MQNAQKCGEEKGAALKCEVQQPGEKKCFYAQQCECKCSEVFLVIVHFENKRKKNMQQAEANFFLW